MSINNIILSFPEYAKDIKLNYSKIINENILEEKQLFSIILIASMATRSEKLLQEALKESKIILSEEIIQDVYGAYSVMSMNVIYYRFTHLSNQNDYIKLPANLRMQYFTKYSLDTVSFEMICLAVAIIEGCGKCINAHEEVLKKSNVSNIKIQAVARIVSIIVAVANVLRVKE